MEAALKASGYEPDAYYSQDTVVIEKAQEGKCATPCKDIYQALKDLHRQICQPQTTATSTRYAEPFALVAGLGIYLSTSCSINKLAIKNI